MKPRDHTWIVIGVLVAFFAALAWLSRRDEAGFKERVQKAADEGQAQRLGRERAQEAARSRLGEHPDL